MTVLVSHQRPLESGRIVTRRSWAALLHAQANLRAEIGANANLQTVKDQSGGVDAGAKITLTNEGSGIACLFRENMFALEER